MLKSYTIKLYCVLLFNALAVQAAKSDTCMLAHLSGPPKTGILAAIGNVTFNTDKSDLFMLSLDLVGNFNNGFYPTSEGVVENINFNITAPDPALPYTAELLPGLSPAEISVSNFYLTSNALFFPDETGNYTFSVNDVSDYGGIFIYNNLDLYCCDDLNYEKYEGRRVQAVNIPSVPEQSTPSQTVYMEAGRYYYVYFLYINLSGDAYFEPSVTFPSGKVVTDFSNYFGNDVSQITCGERISASTVYTEWDGTWTKTYETVILSENIGVGFGYYPYTDIQAVYYVMTPTTPSSSIVPTGSSQVLSSSFASSSIPSSMTSHTTSSSVSPSGMSSSSVSPSGMSSSITISTISSDRPHSSSSAEFSLSVQSITSSKSSQLTISSQNIDSMNKSNYTVVSPVVVSSSSSSLISITTEASVKPSSSINILLSSLNDSNGFANSSAAKGYTSQPKFSSTKNVDGSTKSVDKTFRIISTILEVSSLPAEVTKTTDIEDKISSDVGAFSISTSTDEYGKIGTVIVNCSTESFQITTNDIRNFESIKESSTGMKGHEQSMVSVNSRSHTRIKSQSTRESKVDMDSKTSYYSGNNINSIPPDNTIITWQTVVSQITSPSSSSTMEIQEAPNESPYNTISPMCLITSLLFSIFLM